MSQQYRRARRTPRSQRNKPVLVTSSENEMATNVTEEQSEVSLEATPVIEEPMPLVVPTIAPPEPRRLPRFFSNLGKSEQDVAPKGTKENNVAQARLARAIHGKTVTEIPIVPSAAKNKAATENKTATASTARTVPSRVNTAQPGVFKTRYIIGMGLYLLCANFIGVFEAQFLRSIGLDKPLGPVLFGIFQPTTSNLLFLATLIIILILLARFDLIPRSFSSAASRQSQRPGQRQPQNGTTPGEKVMPPTVRQGVKGTDDSLYQEYRANQRREKKR